VGAVGPLSRKRKTATALGTDNDFLTVNSRDPKGSVLNDMQLCWAIVCSMVQSRITGRRCKIEPENPDAAR